MFASVVRSGVTARTRSDRVEGGWTVFFSGKFLGSFFMCFTWMSLMNCNCFWYVYMRVSYVKLTFNCLVYEICMCIVCDPCGCFESIKLCLNCIVLHHSWGMGEG